MKQEESWQKHYDEIMLFMEQNHRCPSRHRLEDHRMLNQNVANWHFFCWRCQKVVKKNLVVCENTGDGFSL